LTKEALNAKFIRIEHVLKEMSIMHKKLTITVDEKVYEGLYAIVGEGKISQFIENLVKPHVLHQDLELAYKEMAKDKKREEEADEWINGLIGDVHDAKR